MSEISPGLTRNAARALLVLLFGFSIWQISREWFSTGSAARVPASASRRSVSFQRATIVLLPERAGARWPHDTTIGRLLAAQCTRVLLRVPLLLPAPGRPRIEVNAWDIDNLAVSIASFTTRGLRVTIAPVFADAHGLAVEPAIASRDRDAFRAVLIDIVRQIAAASEEGGADAICIPESMLRGYDVPDQQATLRAVRSAFAGMVTLASPSPGAIADEIWNEMEYASATMVPPMSDTAVWSAWRNLALRVHKRVVVELPTARPGHGLWWDTTVDGVFGWDAAYRNTRTVPPPVEMLHWLAAQPWVQGLAVDVTGPDAAQIRTLYDTIRIREFWRAVSRSETILRGTE